ncbi:MAG: DMT family transporter [Janthinobacterium lividum]
MANLAANSAAQPAPRRSSDYLHLAVIYVVWASAYLAMKLGVSGPNALSAYQLQGARLLLGGAVLGLLAWMQGRVARIGLYEFGICAISALLFWVLGNGFAMLALRELPSGFVAMAMGTIPLWSAVLQALLTRRLPSTPLTLLLGFGGLVLILWPTLAPAGGSLHTSWRTLGALLLAPVAWVIASAMQARLQQRMDGMTAASLQLLMGGLMGLLVAWIEYQPLPAHPSPLTLSALLYLALVGSALSFASYIKASALFPISVVAAFAYVNPLVSVLLGWLVVNERPAPISLLGMLVVTASVVVMLNRQRAEQSARARHTRFS